MKYLILLLACATPAAYAQSTVFESLPTKWLVAEAGKQARMSLSEASERVQKSTGGRVLSAQTVREEGRELYRIKVLTPQGEVRIVYINPATGSME